MKKTKSLLSLILVFSIMLTFNLNAYASTIGVNFPDEDLIHISAKEVFITDSGIYIDGIYYTQNQFMDLLEKAQPIGGEGDIQTNSVGALVAGTWWIPGVGKVVVTAAGVVIVAGVVVEVGSWVYKAVVNWFVKRAFNQSAERAVNNCDSNKRHHIMKPKHNWNRFNKNPKWSNTAPIIIKVLKDGTESWETGNQYIRTLVYKGHTVVVRFIKDSEGLVKYISTAWSK